jgi:hypothetical protein
MAILDELRTRMNEAIRGTDAVVATEPAQREALAR